MIVTVTPNPSVDRTYEIDALERGEVLRASASRIQAGGKGVNVVRALHHQGHRARAVVPTGGLAGRRLVSLLEEDHLTVVGVHLAGETRSNVSLVEPDGVVTKINDTGAALHVGEVAALTRAVDDSLDGAVWLATCGSLPPGAPEDLHGRLVDVAHAHGVPAAVDASGPALAAALTHRPDVIKPNEQELAEAVGRHLSSLGAVVEAAEQLREAGAVRVVVSLGADGAVLVDDGGAVHAVTPPVVVRSAVGAGDTLLAGFLAAGGAGPEALRRAVAWGTAAAALPGTSVPAPGDVREDLVELIDLDPDRALGAARS